MALIFLQVLTGARSRALRPLHAQGLRLLAAGLLLALAGCAPVVAPPAAAPLAVPTGETGPAPAGPTPGAGLVIYAPATPSTIPVLLAAARLEQAMPELGHVRVVVFTNQTQASTLFLRGDVPLLVTGLAVGVDFFKQGAPVQALNSYVAGLTYLVTGGQPVKDFRALQGGQVYIPFQGSPIEEITRYFVEQEGLTWGTDIRPVYAPFVSSLELLKQGKAVAVALPEPYATLAERDAGAGVAFGYADRWNRLTGSTTGYPQVVTLAQRPWAEAHPDVIAAFNRELAAAIEAARQDPAGAVVQTATALSVPPDVLKSALARTEFAFRSGDAMAGDIRHYYQVIGKPLDETYGAFFYRALP